MSQSGRLFLEYILHKGDMFGSCVICFGQRFTESRYEYMHVENAGYRMKVLSSVADNAVDALEHAIASTGRLPLCGLWYAARALDAYGTFTYRFALRWIEPN